MVDFPYELVEAFLKNLYTEPFSKPTALTACSLVCRAWRPMSQSLFFSEVTVPFKHPYLSTRSAPGYLSPWFTENPNLLFYVRRLWIRSVQDTCGMESIAGSLPNLKELTISGSGGRDEASEPSTKFLIVLYDCVYNSKNLTSLCISHVPKLPIHLFYLCSSLRNLKIEYTSFEGLVPGAYRYDHDESSRYARSLQKDPPCRTRLQSLDLHINDSSMMDLFMWLMTDKCAFDLSELKTLYCIDRTDAVPPFTRFIKLVEFVSPTLEDLMIDPPTWCGSKVFKLQKDLFLPAKKLGKLHTIRISILQQEDSDFSDQIPWMCSFFSGLPQDHHLEQVLIPCILIDNHLDDFDLTIYDWGLLDAVLTSPKFRSLTKVGLALFQAPDDEQPIIERALNQIIQALPRLNDKGILEVTSSPNIGSMTTDEDWWSRFPVVEK